MTRLFSLASFLGVVANAFAHAPFDTSARAIIHENSIEVTVIAGVQISEKIFVDAQITARPLPAGRPLPIPISTATNFVEVYSDGKCLRPKSAELATDGSEFQFTVFYPLPLSPNLEFRAAYIHALPPPQISPIVVTDENGNISGSAFFQPVRSRSNSNCRQTCSRKRKRLP